jgi:hypothetical protein
MSLSNPHLTCYDQYFRGKKLCRVAVEAIVEDGNSYSGLKKVMDVK